MTETERQDHDGGVLIRVRGDAPDEPTWSGKIEELLDDGCLAIVVDVSGVTGATGAPVLAGWIRALEKQDGFYRLVGASSELRAALVAAGAGPGSLFETVEAAWAGSDEPRWVERDPFPPNQLFVHDGSGAEAEALRAFLGDRERAGVELRYKRETFDEPRGLLWKLFHSRLWPVIVAKGSKVQTFTPRREEAEDEDDYNYHLWDDITPLLGKRPFVLYGERILVGFNEAIATMLR